MDFGSFSDTFISTNYLSFKNHNNSTIKSFISELTLKAFHITIDETMLNFDVFMSLKKIDIQGNGIILTEGLFQIKFSPKSNNDWLF